MGMDQMECLCGEVFQGEKGKGELAVRGAHEEARSPSESGAVDRGAEKNRSRERTDEVTAINLTGERRPHDPKTCVVYRCSLCLAAGKKF
jgi:hypothetical protein